MPDLAEQKPAEGTQLEGPLPGPAPVNLIGPESDLGLEAPESIYGISPPIDHPGWNAIKAWVRKEIALARAGHSEQTRFEQNP